VDEVQKPAVEAPPKRYRWSFPPYFRRSAHLLFLERVRPRYASFFCSPPLFVLELGLATVDACLKNSPAWSPPLSLCGDSISHLCRLLVDRGKSLSFKAPRQNLASDVGPEAYGSVVTLEERLLPSFLSLRFFFPSSQALGAE